MWFSSGPLLMAIRKTNQRRNIANLLLFIVLPLAAQGRDGFVIYYIDFVFNQNTCISIFGFQLHVIIRSANPSISANSEGVSFQSMIQFCNHRDNAFAELQQLPDSALIYLAASLLAFVPESIPSSRYRLLFAI
jgi:hypothetical protein